MYRCLFLRANKLASLMPHILFAPAKCWNNLRNYVYTKKISKLSGAACYNSLRELPNKHFFYEFCRHTMVQTQRHRWWDPRCVMIRSHLHWSPQQTACFWFSLRTAQWVIWDAELLMSSGIGQLLRNHQVKLWNSKLSHNAFLWNFL
jgi:hypothetical protein